MILLRSNLRKGFHFVRPSLSSLTSLRDLEAALQERLIAKIKQVNTQTLKHYSLIDSIQNKLKVEVSHAKSISQRTITVSVINPSNLEHCNVEVRVDQKIQQLNLIAEEFGLPFSKAEDSLTHFSKKRGVPIFDELTEYQMNERTLMIFNLPQNISEQDIQVMVKEKTTDIKLTYCVVGLPAYARVEFDSIQSLERCQTRLVGKGLDFGERRAQIKGADDLERLRLGNRRLVVYLDEDADLQKTLVELSRFGRVMHLDWPIEASMSPTIDQVKQFYKDSFELIQINKHHLDGTVQSEYYPNVQTWKEKEDEREEDNIIQRAQKHKEAYENRARFAKQITVWMGKEHQLCLKHRGYCVVTFSTSEECQNYYFIHGDRTKMEPVGEKLDFEFDPEFRKELLRQIDNEYLGGRKNERMKEQDKKTEMETLMGPPKSLYDQTRYELNEGRSVESYNLFEKLMMRRFLYEGQTKTEDYKIYKEFSNGNQFLEWQEKLRMMKDAKVGKESKTFDQLAQIQLYGRVLPKVDKVERIKVGNTKFKTLREEELINEHILITDLKEVEVRDKFYDRQRERSNRIADQALGIAPKQAHQSTEPEIELLEEKQILDEEGDNIGKHSFATYKPTRLYRKRTAEEEAEYERRYCNYVRNTIYEYMGVFHDHLIQKAVGGFPEVLNPQSLKFTDGASFLTQAELEQVLQYRRDFITAQRNFEDFVIGNQYIKSAGINLNTLHSNYREFESSALQHLTDIGIVQQVRKVKGQPQTLQANVKVLNAEVAQFGQHYQLEKTNDDQYLVKLRKLEHLMPLDIIARLEGVVHQFEKDISEEEAKIFEKYYVEMKESGKIHDAVSKAFGIEKGMNVNDLMIEIGLANEISKKDLEMADKVKTYSKQQIRDDIQTQKRIEIHRSKKKKLQSKDFVKDPSQIYVKDREGYFKVSRYRQI